jgi:hypothetical protein
MDSFPNPFFYGGTLKQSDLFIGRQREVHEICEAISASASVSIVGERRIGKSSLLRYLADPSIKRKNGLDTRDFVFVHFDFLGYPTITPTELWRHLLHESISQLEDPLETSVRNLAAQPEISLADLDRLMRHFKDARRSLVILLDEFDTAAGNPNFDQAFYGALRNLSKYPLSYIVASHRSLSELQYAHPDAIVSPFFNIFRRVTLGGFTSEDVEALLNSALRGTGITFDQNDRKRIDQWADSHPYFVQMTAYFLFDAHRYGYRRNNQIDYRWALERVRDNSYDHFRYYWDQSTAGEKLVLSILALVESEELSRFHDHFARNAPILRRLIERVLVMTPEGAPYRLFSTVFGEWIAETIAFVPVEQVPDFDAEVKRLQLSGFQRSWLDASERIRKGFAWLDIRTVVKWLVSSKSAEAVVDIITQVLKTIP